MCSKFSAYLKMYTLNYNAFVLNQLYNRLTKAIALCVACFGAFAGQYIILTFPIIGLDYWFRQA